MDDKRPFFETQIENWSDLFLLNHGFTSRFVYRGQADSTWGLSSSLERLVKLYHPYTRGFHIIVGDYANRILEDFKWKYPIYCKGQVPNDEDTLEWYSILQHYGAPTQMVDFTYSPYIALYMAIEKSTAQYCSIWCLNKNVYTFPITEELSRKTGQCFTTPFALEKYMHDQVNLRLRGCIIKNAQPGVFLMRPKQVNERILRQHGLFAIPRDMSISFEENVFSRIANKEAERIEFKEVIEYSNSPNGTNKQKDIALIKINVPTKLRLDIVKYLNEININAETMYPGLEGLARSMAYPRINI